MTVPPRLPRPPYADGRRRVRERRHTLRRLRGRCPRADETTLDGAEAWTSADWSIAHISAIVGLILIPLGYGAIRGFLDGTPQERTA